MPNIDIVGLTGEGKIGAYEKQLGNMAILIPMIELLHAYVPNASISTTIQLTDEFCDTFGVTRIPNPKRHLPFLNRWLRQLIAVVDFLRISLWRYLVDSIGLDIPGLTTRCRLKRFANSDVVLDFNGDIFPSDTSHRRVLWHALEIATISQLGPSVVEFVSSPGPFDTRFARAVSRLMFKRVCAFTNREPKSTELLVEIGIDPKKIVNTACPAFLLKPVAAKRSQEILESERVDSDSRPLVGITLCGYNLSSQRTWGRPRHFGDLMLYVPMLRYLLDELNANVFLLPHVYRVNPFTLNLEFINGPDHDILLALYKLAGGEEYQGRFNVINGKYSSPEAKGVIGQCDMFISGRLHAGVAALSQSIPTVLLAYGHKHFGFASLLGQEKYVFADHDAQALKSLVKDAWKHREETAKTLAEGMARVEERVNLNFEIVREIADFDWQGKVPEKRLAAWRKMGG